MLLRRKNRAAKRIAEIEQQQVQRLEAVVSENQNLRRHTRMLRRTGRFLYRYGIIIFNIVSIVAAVVLYLDLAKSPYPIYKYPDDDILFDQNQENPNVLFDRPVPDDVLKPYIFPEIKGEWKLEPVYPWLPMVKRKVTFYPEETFFPDTKMFIYYAGIESALSLKSENWEFSTNTFTLPPQQIVSIDPEDGANDVGVNSAITVTFDRLLDKYSEWEVVFSPPVEFTLQQRNDTLIINFKNNLAQTQEYNYQITRSLLRYDLEKNEIIERQDPEMVKTGKFTTIKEPLIESFAPSGEGVFADAEIKVVFDAEMDKQSVSELFKIEPAVQGEIIWEDGRTMVYKHGGLAKETNYTLSFSKGLTSASGGITEKDISHTFSTIGKLAITGYTPRSGATNVAIDTNIIVSFNQQADKSSAQSKFSISPDAPGSFSWNGNNLVYNPNTNLAYGTTYTITFASGIKSVHGVDSAQAFSSKFTTKVQNFKLNLPVIYQKHSFSCNIDATRIALGYRGVSLSTEAIYAQLPKDATPYSENNGEKIWGNPHSGFVGDINGNPKGYGVYWGPISGFVSKYRSSAVKTGWNRTELLTEVSNNNPVIIWAHNGYSSSPNGAVGTNISWKTPGGQSIYAIAGMHSFVVAGWNGNMENPTHIVLHDTNRGVWTITTSYFDSLWGVFNNSAVVVY